MEKNSSESRIDKIIEAVRQSLSSGIKVEEENPVPAGMEDSYVWNDFVGQKNADDSADDPLFEEGVELLMNDAYEQAIDVFSRVIEIDPEISHAYSNRARCHWELGDLGQAADDFMECLARDPGDIEPLVCLGEVLSQDDRNDEAVKVLNTAVEQLKNVYPVFREMVEDRARSQLSLSLLAVNDFENALSSALQLLLMGPESSFVYDLLGKIRLGLGDHEGALNDFEKAIAIDRSDPDPYVSRAKYYIASGDKERADADLQQALALASDDSDAAVVLGMKLMDIEETRWAVKSFTNAIRLDPDTAEALYYRATLTMDEDPKTAYSDIEQALALDPEMVEAYLTQGYLLNKFGEADAALSAYKHCVSLAPGNADNQATLGIIHLEMRQFLEALTCFELALKLDDQCDLAYIGRGAMFSDLGDYAAALADAKTVLQRDTENVQALIIRGAAMMETGNIEDAVADFELAIHYGDIDSRPNALVCLALALIKKGSIVEAAARLDEAGRIDPDEVEVHYARATLDKSLGDYGSAACHIDLALQDNDSESRYHELHGEILEGKGDASAARAAYEKALQLAVSRRDKENLRDKIATL